MSVVYTVGYEGTDIERFIETLKVVGVKCLCGRATRIADFAQEGLFPRRSWPHVQKAKGIQYLHFQPLGDPKSGREASPGQDNTISSVLSMMPHLDSDDVQASLRELMAVAGGNVHVAFCASSANPSDLS